MRTARRFALGAAATAAVAAFVVPHAPHAFASPESDAADAIDQAWQAAGGAGSDVGGKEGDIFTVGDGYGQKFSDGKIYYSADSGAHLIYGAILDKYESLGGPADSDLGWPNINEVPGLVGSGSRVSTFNGSDKPAIFWTPDTGAWAVRGALNVAWDKLGGSSGTLGVPVEDESYDGDLVKQKFTGGELSWNSASNTFTSEPAALADSLVGLEVPLDPTTRINQAWRFSGGLGGPLGARQGPQTPVGDGGAAQGYAGGKIFYSPATGAHSVTGAILSKYESLGGPTGDLGFPIGTENEGGAPNSRISAFSAPDKPVIFWTPDNGAIVVRGALNAAWDKLGGASGTLGVPTGEQQVNGDTVTQTFSGGEVSWNNATKEFSTKPADLASTLNGLQIPDSVGQAPTGTGGETKAKSSGWHWWWLAIILPLVALLGLLALWAQRRGRSDDGDRYYAPQREVADRDRTTDWAPTAVKDEADFDDEDRIDTAPTRIPSQTKLDEFTDAETTAEISWGDDAELGRHSAGASGVSSLWRMELDDLERPRRRHAVDDAPSWWTDTHEGFEESGELREPELDFDYGDEVVEEVEVNTVVTTTPEQPFEDLFGQPAEDWHAEAAEALEDDEEPWRPAIHLPLADPYQAPEGYFIKANTHSGLYYTQESALYDGSSHFVGVWRCPTSCRVGD